MFLNKDGLNDKFYQYLCTNICQVKNTINEITKTNSVTSDWKELCYKLKKDGGGSSSYDYVFFDKDGNQDDCYVFIGYDQSIRAYLVWIEY